VDPTELDFSETVRALLNEPARRDVVEDAVATTPEPSEADARHDGQSPPAPGQGVEPAEEREARPREPMTLEGLAATLDPPEDPRTVEVRATTLFEGLVATLDPPEDQGIRTESAARAVENVQDLLTEGSAPEDDPLRVARAPREAVPERGANMPASGRDAGHADHTRHDPVAAESEMEDDATDSERTEVLHPTISDSAAPWRSGAARARALELWSMDDGQRREAVARAAPAPVDYDLGECVTAALRAVAPDPEIAVRLQYPAGIRMRGDSRALQWMVCEVVDNAINALAALAPEHPRALSVTCGLEADGNATIRCLDSGAGFQDDTILPARPPGGLALVRAVLAADGGTLSVRSLRGRGTLAVLSVPDTDANKN
jgi:hypothetical protein